MGGRRGCAPLPSRGPHPARADRKEPVMKMNSELVEQTVRQFDAHAIPDSHPVVEQLSRVFGDHTFFVDDNGVHIVEPSDAARPGAQAALVVKLASWDDAARTSLVAHEPEATDVVVVLGTGDPDRAS